VAPQARAPDAQCNHGVHVHLLSASPPRTPAVLYPPLPCGHLAEPKSAPIPMAAADARGRASRVRCRSCGHPRRPRPRPRPETRRRGCAEAPCPAGAMGAGACARGARPRTPGRGRAGRRPAAPRRAPPAGRSIVPVRAAAVPPAMHWHDAPAQPCDRPCSCWTLRRANWQKLVKITAQRSMWLL